LLPFVKELVLHLSRGVRWDSDHVVLKDDDLVSLAQEIVRANALTRVHIGLDFFDASINRIGAWVIGARAALKAFLYAVLEPVDLLREMELAGDFFGRLALLEELKGLPFGVVWDWYCAKMDVPIGREWILEIRDHENRVLSNR
ncbi:MAG: L-rhamnose isomerase, partial [Candidatus Adiutricales bacterium]